MMIFMYPSLFIIFDVSNDNLKLLVKVKLIMKEQLYIIKLGRKLYL